MQKWPPTYPRNDLAVETLQQVILNAKILMEDEDLATDERKIVEAMRPGNTMIGLSIEKNDQLAVLLETFRKIRFRTHKILLSAPVEHFFSLPVRIAHAAANALTKEQARRLSNLLAHDFVDFSQEQYTFAKQVGAPLSELGKINPERYDAPLRKIHRLIRERALPLTVG